MDKLGIRELLRYGYAGILCVLVAALVNGEGTGALIARLGDVLSPLAAIAIGAAVYLIFRTLVGDVFLWRFVNWSHPAAERLLKRHPTRCRVRYLEDTHRVPKGKGLAAYALIRDTRLDPRTRERFHTQHSEGYLLYLTAFICGPISLLAWGGLLPGAPSAAIVRGLGATAVVAFCAALLHDTVLCRDECAAIAVLPQDVLAKTLQDGGFAPRMEQANGGMSKG